MSQGAEQLELGGIATSPTVEPSASTSTPSVAPTSEFEPPNLPSAIPPSPGDPEVAPMLRHYLSVKAQYPEHLLLYQVGDFYEVFYEDAIIVSAAVQIRLTSRSKEGPNAVPMCGVPLHAIDNYLPKLVQQGHSCLLVSQVESAEGKRGMVRREITRVITPGVRYEGDGLESKSFNFIGAVLLGPRGDGAFAYADVSTGFFSLLELDSREELLDSLERLHPVELLIPAPDFEGAGKNVEKAKWLRDVAAWARESGVQVRRRPYLDVSPQRLSESLSRFQNPERVGTASNSLESLSLESISAVQVLLDYVEEVSFGRRPRLGDLQIQERSASAVIDAATQRNLELIRSRHDGEKQHALLHHIDYTKTAMGSRLLSTWLLNPCTQVPHILERLDAVSEFVETRISREQVREELARVRDLERILSRLITLRANPRDLGILADSLSGLDRVAAALDSVQSELLVSLRNNLDCLEDVRDKLTQALADELPMRVSDGGIFRPGYHSELDNLRDIQQHSGERLLEMEARERQTTGISSLKVRYTNAFGYFLEIPKAHLAKVPTHYDRRQTLVGAERFVTTELREFEQKTLSAKARQLELEQQLFRELRDWLLERVDRIQSTGEILTRLDVLCALAHLSLEHKYCRPEFVSSGDAVIRSGRHPVVERMIGPHNFVPNDTILSREERRFAVLTGPNMGGKSTYLRQIGLIQILAQAGSYVPAQEAKLHLVDRIFTRIGASDDLARGDSTFMVEMREAASILRRATGDSLVLIDEIGRGTATTDGLAIATSIAEWLRDQLQCKTVFATHFHELTELAQVGNGAFCIAVGIVERDKEIIFTHRIEERVADRSYGIEVARLAGLPEAVLKRAEQVMSVLLAKDEKADFIKSGVTPVDLPRDRSSAPVSTQPLQSDGHMISLCERLEKINPDRLTPIQALTELVSLREILKAKDH